ncbi:DUF1853 family protein [Gammaproteobacteria bacterium LSUCC0112]|nr:DUF1853 family protein [Gammaproteobacteria bacterium LSUCC0112]
MAAPDAPDLHQFQTPAVRHLAWLCHAPQLIQDASVFEPARYLPANYLAMLQEWDTHPTNRPDALNAPPHYRLGYYLESLYACLITDVLGWTMLARNLPVRTGGTTLGELDFLLHNPHTDAVEHHEIAIKFYLGYPGSAEYLSGWYGPNPQDRLDIKTARMLGPQSQRGLLPETLDVLAHRGIKAPAITRVFMPGYLFYPHKPTTEVTIPISCPENHLRGQWIYLDKVTSIDTRTWVPLAKPHWLGPWGQTHMPDDIALTDAFADIKDTQTPRLFAVLQHEHISGLWKEIDRVFVVPAHWPRSD